LGWCRGRGRSGGGRCRRGSRLLGHRCGRQFGRGGGWIRDRHWDRRFGNGAHLGGRVFRGWGLRCGLGRGRGNGGSNRRLAGTFRSGFGGRRPVLVPRHNRLGGSGDRLRFRETNGLGGRVRRRPGVGVGLGVTGFLMGLGRLVGLGAGLFVGMDDRAAGVVMRLPRFRRFLGDLGGEVGGRRFVFVGRDRVRHADDRHRGELMRLRGGSQLCEGQQLLLKVFSGDLVQGAGRHLGGGDSHFLRPGENELALEVELLGDVVDADGHTGDRERESGLGVMVGLQ